MPRIIELGQRSDAMTVDECAAAIASSGFDARCEASVLAVAGYLKALGENRTFLGDWMIGLLAGTGKRDGPDSSYSAQSIMLTAPRDGFFLRANIWPSERDSCFRRSGAHSFAYGAAHDHNFDFLTYGYLGPGYRSDYFEYDHHAVAGYRGEPAGLRFIERSALHEGKLMHYRAHRDVHSQLPPDSLSVSLNVMACDPSQGWYDQYGFDLAQGTVSDVLSTGSTETFLRAAVAMGGDNAIGLAQDWGRSHPSDRIRLAGFEARAHAAANVAERDEIWRDAEQSGSVLVAKEAARKRRLIA
uniref:transposase n=1 Tax=Parerythrobacter lutipelagi TaxID=1964208 RepID=UPI0018642908|nr:transposase [Parerythrobacter lutipelagi]